LSEEVGGEGGARKRKKSPKETLPRRRANIKPEDLLGRTQPALRGGPRTGVKIGGKKTPKKKSQKQNTQLTGEKDPVSQQGKRSSRNRPRKRDHQET